MITQVQEGIGSVHDRISSTQNKGLYAIFKVTTISTKL